MRPIRKSVKEEIGECYSSEMLCIRCLGRENEALGRDTGLLGRLTQVLIHIVASGEQPEHAAGRRDENLHPLCKGTFGNLLHTVEACKNESAFRQPRLRS